MVDEELKDFLESMQRQIGDLQKETSAFREESRHEFGAVRRENAVLHSETRRHFDVALEATRHELQLVAETVLHLDKKLTARMDETDKRVDQRFADTHAMIKFAREQPDRPAGRRTKPN
jgi:hypothetical protein